MKVTSKILLLLGAIGFVSFWGCKPESCDEEVPSITYKSFERSQDSARLTITFLDCNGDIGLREDENEPPYDFNLFVDYLEFIDGEWVKLQLDSNNDLKYRVPIIEANGNTNKLEGDLELTMLNSKFGTADSVTYEVYLLDRALNESNRVRSPIIFFP